MRWTLSSAPANPTKETWLEKLDEEDNPKLKLMREKREARQREKGIEKTSQEPAPKIFADLVWVWSTFCFLSDRRGVSANGPVPITVEAMHAYLKLINRYQHPYTEQMLHFIPIMDRVYLHDFYEKQRKDMDKQKRKAESGTKTGIGRKR